MKALDRFYTEQTEGLSYCPTCHQLKLANTGYLVIDAIDTYVTMVAEHRSSAKEIRHRLAHVLDYLDTLPDAGVPCEAVDEHWIQRFRAWLMRRPIVGKSGTSRPRSLSTVENSVIQLAAAINDAHDRRNTVLRARFRPQPPRLVNRTPRHRAGVAGLAEMFRFCVSPSLPLDTTPEKRARTIRERDHLHRFLVISVATLARPDAAHDVSTAPARRQWNSNARVLDLNPHGRQQTRKRRAVIPIAWQVAHLLEATDGFFVPVKSVRSAWDSMADAIGLPGGGESGMKLVRRSMADEVRRRLKAQGKGAGELEVFLGHRDIDSVTELYAPFDPAYLADVRAIVEEVIDEIEAAVPGSFSRKVAGGGAEVILIGRAKNG